MLGYYLKIACSSLRRTPITTLLMVLAIGLGIGASMTMLTVLHVMSRDPLPARSARLYVPHLDPLPKNYPANSEWGDPSNNLTWPDAMELLHAKRATAQAAMAGGHLLVWPEQERTLPVELDGRYATHEFFPMFGLPFVTGQGWGEADDEAHARVVVLSQALARKLFGTNDPMGKAIQLGEHQTGFRVIGIVGDWEPQPLFYADASSKGGFGTHDDFFLPLSTAVELGFGSDNHFAGWGSNQTEDMHTDPATAWLQFWVQLDTPQQVADYRSFLHEYAAQQHASGRFERPAETARLYSLMDWLQHLRLVPDDVHLQVLLAGGFLLVCLANIIALLLAKFLRRGSEIGVRRALGAQRRHIFLQFGIEALLVGALGGLLGIVVAEVGLWSIRQRPDAYAHVAQMDAAMLLATVTLAIAAAVLAGLLPAWRASRIAPALQIKAL